MRIRKTRRQNDDTQEAYLQDKLVIPTAQKFGWLVFHVHDSRRSAPGFPDLTMVRGKRLVFVELKRPSGKPTPEQEAWLAALSAAGVECYIWRLVDWDSGAIERMLR